MKQGMSMSSTYQNQQRHLPQPLKGPIIIGYASNAKSGKAERAIQVDGANVIIWSFVHLESTDDNNVDDSDIDNKKERAKIRTGSRDDWSHGGLDLQEIKKIRERYEHVLHLAAFGGWNGPHPPPTSHLSGKDWFDVFHQFNIDNGHLFDGVDWDYEGHDDLSSPTAKFTLKTLDVMVDFSLEAKRHGYVVSMAPAESYLDASIKQGSIDDQFSLSLDLEPRAWTSDRYHATEEDRALVQSKGFSHAGRQCYAYVIAKAGIDTFDWISIQLYESYSPFAHDIHRRNIDPVEALMIRINRLVDGYKVTNLPMDPTDYEVKVPLNKLVIGLGNGWVDGLKVCKVDAASVRSAYEATFANYGQGFLGCMFWTIEEEPEAEDRRLTHLLKTEFNKLGQRSEL